MRLLKENKLLTLKMADARTAYISTKKLAKLNEKLQKKFDNKNIKLLYKLEFLKIKPFQNNDVELMLEDEAYFNVCDWEKFLNFHIATDFQNLIDLNNNEVKKKAMKCLKKTKLKRIKKKYEKITKINLMKVIHETFNFNRRITEKVENL